MVEAGEPHRVYRRQQRKQRFSFPVRTRNASLPPFPSVDFLVLPQQAFFTEGNEENKECEMAFLEPFWLLQ
jgi:hypothetical protein